MARQMFSFRGNVGIGFQSEYGTAVARTAFTRYLESDVQRAHGQEMQPTSRLSAEEDASLGDYDVNVVAKIEGRPETVGAFLRAHAGDGSVTTTQPDAVNHPTVYEHQIDHKDTRLPVSWEDRLGTHGESELVDSVVLEEVQLEFARNILVLGMKGPGRKDSILATPTTPTFDAKRALLRHEATITLGGTVFSVKAARVTLAAAVTKDDYGTGSRYRIDADVGARKLQAEYELAFRDATLLKRSLGAANATEPKDDPLYNADKLAVNGPVIAGAHKYGVEVDMPRCWWEPIGVPRRGKDGLTQRVRAHGLYDETAGYLWRAKVTNTLSAL